MPYHIEWVLDLDVLEDDVVLSLVLSEDVLGVEKSGRDLHVVMAEGAYTLPGSPDVDPDGPIGRYVCFYDGSLRARFNDELLFQQTRARCLAAAGMEWFMLPAGLDVWGEQGGSEAALLRPADSRTSGVLRVRIVVHRPPFTVLQCGGSETLPGTFMLRTLDLPADAPTRPVPDEHLVSLERDVGFWLVPTGPGSGPVGVLMAGSRVAVLRSGRERTALITAEGTVVVVQTADFLPPARSVGPRLGDFAFEEG